MHIVKLQFDTQKGKRRLKSSLRKQQYYTEMGNMYLQNTQQIQTKANPKKKTRTKSKRMLLVEDVRRTESPDPAAESNRSSADLVSSPPLISS